MEKLVPINARVTKDDRAVLDNLAKDQCSNRSAAVRLIIKEWQEMKLLQFVPVQDKVAAMERDNE